jgi:hypothetical protein
MVVRVHGGIIDDQMLTGSLRYFNITDAGGLGTDAIGDVNGRVDVAVLVDAGSSYVGGNVLTVSGGTSATAATITVHTPPPPSVGAGGEIELYAISNPGDYSVLPANPVSVTGGAGTLATFNLIFSSGIIVPGAAPQPGQEVYVGWQKPVPDSAADQALREIAKFATIVQIGIVSANVIRIACENTGFGWDRPGGGDAAADMQTAIVALGSVTVPDGTNTGTAFDFTGATVAESTFAAL